MRFKSINAILFTAFFGFCCIINSIAQQTTEKELISPIHGKLMLVGTGEITARSRATFAFLAGEEDGNLLILNNAGKRGKKICPQWEETIGNITVLTLDKTNNGFSSGNIDLLKSATAVWLVGDLSKQYVGTPLHNELKNLLLRGGIIGGQGIAAESMAALIKDGDHIRDGFDLLPNACICTSKDKMNEFPETMNSLPGRVGWEIPPQAAVVIHNGRQISVLDFPDITLRTAANGDWAERVATFGPPIDDLPFTTDLISWNRSGVARLNEVFPPAVAPVPEVPNGALVIVGGHGFPDGMWERVVDFAGGTDANYVCFSQTESSTGAERLRDQGCKNVAVHVVKSGVDGIGQADDAQLLEDLKDANAVYFGGGRTYKFMDAFLNTEAHLLMNKVLERGGIILGGSAGAQIQGDFLVRGDPRTNNTMWMEGNDVGLSFIRGIIIDVHFRERGRENTLPSLLVNHPQMLGIGIDETTAIWVQGTTAEVLGPHSVNFYDLKKTKNLNPSSLKTDIPLVLMKGEKYNLKLREIIDAE